MERERETGCTEQTLSFQGRSVWTERDCTGVPISCDQELVATAQGSSLLGLPWVCESIRTEMFRHHLIHREQQCNHMLHTQERMQLQTAFLVMFKEKTIEIHLCVTGINPQPERLLALVAHHSRVVTEGLRPSQGNYISHVLAEKKFISSCN